MFDIVGNRIVLKAEELAYEPFRTIYNSQDDKSMAIKYIEYIVWMNKPTSRYVKAYPPHDRERTVKLDVFGDAKFKLPKEMPEWEAKYNDLSQTPASRLLRSARNKVEDIIKFFNESSNLDSADAFKVVSTLSKIGALTESLKKLEAEVLIEENTTKTVRGGYEIGRHEIPEKKF
jgi:hypothetical protein